MPRLRLDFAESPVFKSDSARIFYSIKPRPSVAGFLLPSRVQQILNQLIRRRDHAAGRGESRRGDDHVGKLFRQIDVAVFQRSGPNRACGQFEGPGDLRHAAICAGRVKIPALILQAFGIVERRDRDLSKRAGQTVVEAPVMMPFVPTENDVSVPIDKPSWLLISSVELVSVSAVILEKSRPIVIGVCARWRCD